jgi:hypothetical protein
MLRTMRNTATQRRHGPITTLTPPQASSEAHPRAAISGSCRRKAHGNSARGRSPLVDDIRPYFAERMQSSATRSPAGKCLCSGSIKNRGKSRCASPMRSRSAPRRPAAAGKWRSFDGHRHQDVESADGLHRMRRRGECELQLRGVLRLGSASLRIRTSLLNWRPRPRLPDVEPSAPA